MHRAVVLTDALSMLCEVFPFYLIRKIEESPPMCFTLSLISKSSESLFFLFSSD